MQVILPGSPGSDAILSSSLLCDPRDWGANPGHKQIPQPVDVGLGSGPAGLQLFGTHALLLLSQK